ncbi:MAG: hypothetical protein U0169_27640 [Polyangiaceae bacterium]
MRLAIRLAVVHGILVTGIAACGSTSTGHDAGTSDASTGDGATDAASVTADGAIACTFASRGYPNARTTPVRVLGTERDDEGRTGACSGVPQTFATAAAYEAYLARRRDGGAGALPADAGAGVDWTTEVVAVVPVPSDVSLVDHGKDGDTLVVLGSRRCQGSISACEFRHVAVATVTRAVLEVCPYVGECLAP